MVAAGVRLKKLFFTPDELTLTKFRSANEQVPASQKQLAVFQPFFFIVELLVFVGVPLQDDGNFLESKLASASQLWFLVIALEL